MRFIVAYLICFVMIFIAYIAENIGSCFLLNIALLYSLIVPYIYLNYLHKNNKNMNRIPELVYQFVLFGLRLLSIWIVFDNQFFDAFHTVFYTIISIATILKTYPIYKKPSLHT